MSGKRSSRGLKTTIASLLIFACIIVGIIWYFGGFDGESNSRVAKAVEGELQVHFIDVGQGDCILIESQKGAVLIDAGDKSDASKVCSYIDGLGITKLDYVIGTHAHFDHMGGMDDVLSDYKVGALIIPTRSSESQFYQNVLNTASERRIITRTADVGEVLNAAGGELTVIADGSETSSDLNNNSYILKLDFGETSFLFTGDAGTDYEKDVLYGGADIDSDVLKVGHHGSATSTSELFLDAVSPEAAVIMVGIDNDYGHPSSRTVDLLTEKGIDIYRTDENGDIIFKTDGKELSVICTEE